MPASLASRDGQIWLDGRYVEWQDATLHVLSHGLHYAASVFEGARAYEGPCFQAGRALPTASALGSDPRDRSALHLG